MIEKLDRRLRQERDSDFTISEPVSIGEMQEKINELIDVVNDLVFCVDNDIPYHAEKAKTEPADPYAEQRKWIGKLCRCWDSDINNDTWGILQDIRDNKTEKYYMYGIGYEHCEPVIPDDNIIYKKK